VGGKARVAQIRRRSNEGACAVAGRVYELARKAGLGYEVPTRLFLQDTRD